MLKQPQNLSLFLIHPVSVKYYCLFQSWHALTISTRDLSFNCCSLHRAVKWFISKTEVSCTEGQMHWLCSVTYALMKNGERKLVLSLFLQSWLQNQESNARSWFLFFSDIDWIVVLDWAECHWALEREDNQSYRCTCIGHIVTLVILYLANLMMYVSPLYWIVVQGYGAL